MLAVAKYRITHRSGWRGRVRSAVVGGSPWACPATQVSTAVQERDVSGVLSVRTHIVRHLSWPGLVFHHNEHVWALLDEC